MNINLFAKSILLVLAAVSYGCSSDESSDKTLSESEQILLVRKAVANAPEKISEKENLPVWLSELIDRLGVDDMVEVVVYQGKWKGEIVYYVSDTYSSCLTCNTFKTDGERFDWSKIDSADFWKSATDWNIIYVIKSKISDR